jgi:hypothetical protein
MLKEYGCEVRSCEVSGSSLLSDNRWEYSIQCVDAGVSRTIYVEGVLTQGRIKRTLDRIASIQATSKQTKDAFVMPRLLGSLESLPMLIWEKLEGVPFLALLGTPEGLIASEKLGKALAILHMAEVPGERKPRRLTEIVDDLVVRIETQIEKEKILCTNVQRLLRRKVRRDLKRFSPEASAAISQLTPNDLLWLDHRVGIRGINGIDFRHPFLDLGRLIAQMRVTGIEMNRSAEMEIALHRVLESYQAMVGRQAEGIHAFESFALLETVISRLESNKQGELSEQLFQLADRRMKRGKER